MNNQNIYQDLRDRAFSETPELLHLEVSPDTPFGVIMDIGRPLGTSTLVCFLTGDASMYFSNGSGIIGGIGNKIVQELSIKFVEQSKIFLEKMIKTTSFPIAENGSIVFYILTKNGVFTASEKEDDLVNKKSSLSQLFFSGSNIISGLIEMEKSKSSKS